MKTKEEIDIYDEGYFDGVQEAKQEFLKMSWNQIRKLKGEKN